MVEFSINVLQLQFGTRQFQKTGNAVSEASEVGKVAFQTTSLEQVE